MLTRPQAVVPGVYRMPLPLPFELREVNTYLIRLKEGWMLVDTGLSIDACFESLCRQLASIGVELPEIRQILITHTHPDHVGGARRLLQLTGAKLLMEERELGQLRRAAAGTEWLMTPLVNAAVPVSLRDEIEVTYEPIRTQFHPLEPDRVLHEGDEIETAIGPLRVLTTPGHSVGHACLWSERHRMLFAGDTLLETITPNISWMAGRDMLGEFFTSLERVWKMEIDILLPGHYETFTRHREWITSTRAHHDERCEVIVASLEGGLRSAHELVGHVWPRVLAPFHHRFAVYEVLAHLEYLRRRERVFLEPQDGFHLWRV